MFRSHCFIMRKSAATQENRWNLSQSPVCARIVDDLKIVLLHTGDGEKFKKLFYAKTHSLK